jgi:hypothetical protein
MSQLDIQLEIFPTIFPEYNKQNSLPTDHVTTTLKISRLKHGHLRAMQKLSANDQIHFLMSQLTGLSQNDLDELDIEDSAKLSEIMFDFMKRFAQIAKTSNL